MVGGETRAPYSERMTSTVGRRHHVVIIGSGFGGLFAAKHLKSVDVDVTMISRVNHHLFQPLLYQVATGILSEGEIAPATREVLRKQSQPHGAAGRGDHTSTWPRTPSPRARRA